MITLISPQKTFLTGLFYCLLTVMISGCSDDKTTAGKTESNETTIVSASEQEKFEQRFENQCVSRELKTGNKAEMDKEHLRKTCGCIAQYLMKDLTAQEAEKFLDEHENPESLIIRYDAAAYHCLQEKTPQSATAQ